jgi:hypothetical protein
MQGTERVAAEGADEGHINVGIASTALQGFHVANAWPAHSY